MGIYLTFFEVPSFLYDGRSWWRAVQLAVETYQLPHEHAPYEQPESRDKPCQP